MKWNPLKLSEFWTSVELKSVGTDQGTKILHVAGSAKKKVIPHPRSAPRPHSKCFWGKRKKQVRAGELGLSFFLVTPLGTLSLVTQPCSQGCSRTWWGLLRAVGLSAIRVGLCQGHTHW